MSLLYGYENKHESDLEGKLSTSGGKMKGNINMGSNHITTSVDPSQNSHLARKKYVDDTVAHVTGLTSLNYLPKSGGVMTGNINMGNNKIKTNLNPTHDKDLCRKKYVDDSIVNNLNILKKDVSFSVSVSEK